MVEGSEGGAAVRRSASSSLLLLSLLTPPRPNTMKPCSACLAELPKEAYSKKQWQAKQIRRCKGCIQVGREPSPPKEEEGSKDHTAALVHEGNDGDWERTWPKKKRALIRNDEPVGAIDEEALFRQPPPTEDCGESLCILWYFSCPHMIITYTIFAQRFACCRCRSRRRR